MISVIEWRNDALRLLDQTRLPTAIVYRDCTRVEEVAEAIRTLRVRGAPAIGVSGAYGLALAARQSSTVDLAAWRRHVTDSARLLKSTRPTAVNLAWAIDRALASTSAVESVREGQERLLCTAHEIAAEDDAANRRLGALGATLLSDSRNLLTHCNAGGLGTTGFGTALGVIRVLHAAGRPLRVWVDETRPVLQGARLTAWELLTEGIPHTIIADGAAGFLMQRGEVDAVITGADRIAANGDVANKIGTYALAVLAKAHAVPFYVAAPTSTIDCSIATGREIPIEERSSDEIKRIGGVLIAPAESPALNLAFDVTPNELVHAIITEAGIAYPPYTRSLRFAPDEENGV